MLFVCVRQIFLWEHKTAGLTAVQTEGTLATAQHMQDCSIWGQRWKKKQASKLLFDNSFLFTVSSKLCREWCWAQFFSCLVANRGLYCFSRRAAVFHNSKCTSQKYAQGAVLPSWLPQVYWGKLRCSWPPCCVLRDCMQQCSALHTAAPTVAKAGQLPRLTRSRC